MQYPPEQSRADFSLPSQPPPLPRLAIVVHFRRPRMIFLLLGSVAVLALLVALFWVLAQNIPLGIAILSYGVLSFSCLLVTASIFRALLLHEPALIIDPAGIQILTLGVAGRCFLSWPEMGMLAEDSSRGHRYLQIHPKTYPQYLSRLPVFKRIMIGYWTRWPSEDPPLFQVPVRDLERPGIAIFQQLAHLYARELDYYHVYLQLAHEDIPAER